MTSFAVNRAQYPIGQGGFHSTHVFEQGERFSLIYDCGGSTTTHRARIIKEFLGPSDPQYDWLVISHLDRDHINGIPELEQAGITFSNVVLPHVDPAKYMLYLTAALGATLATAEIFALVSIVAGLYGGRYGKPVMIVNDGGNLEPGDVPPDALAGSSPLMDEPTRRIFARATMGSTLGAGRSVTLGKSRWQFRFYSAEWHCPKDILKIWAAPEFANLKRAMDELAKKGNKPPTVTIEACINAELERKVPKPGANALAIRLFGKALTFRGPDISIKKLLSKLYELAPGIRDYNAASLCLYSGPATGVGYLPSAWYRRALSGNVRVDAPHALLGRASRSVGWIGMGDAQFKKGADLTRFRDHYFAQLPHVSCIVLPHHGSQHNYDRKLLHLENLLKPLARSENLVIVAAADPNGTYGHPHRSVTTLCEEHGTVHKVTDQAETILEESIEVVEDHRRTRCWFCEDCTP